MRVGVDLSAFATLHDEAMRLMVRDIYEEFGFASATAIGLIALTGLHRRSGRVFDDGGRCNGLGGNDFHIKLRHSEMSF